VKTIKIKNYGLKNRKDRRKKWRGGRERGGGREKGGGGRRRENVY